MKLRKLASAFVIVGLLAGCGASTSCATLKPPATLTQTGDIAWYADKAIHAVQALQDVAISGEQAGVIPTTDARKIVEATKIAGQAGVDLAAALKAGQNATTAKEKAIAALRSVLDTLPPQLSANTQTLIAPYLQTIRTLLSVFV